MSSIKYKQFIHLTQNTAKCQIQNSVQNLPSNFFMGLENVLQLAQNALFYAVQGGYVECVKVLLDHGADINAKTGYGNFTAIMFAASRGHLECLKVLLGRGADIHARDSLQNTALMKAESMGHVECVNALCDFAEHLQNEKMTQHSA